MEEREVIFMGVCVIEGPSLYDLGEPDDLFADIDNFAVYAMFPLNLTILVKEEREVLFILVCFIEGPSLYDLGEPDDLFADIRNFAVYAIFRLNLTILCHRRIFIRMGLCHQGSTTVTLENLVIASLQTYLMLLLDLHQVLQNNEMGP
jgi:hypothetical protein